MIFFFCAHIKVFVVLLWSLVKFCNLIDILDKKQTKKPSSLLHKFPVPLNFIRQRYRHHAE